MNDTEKVLEEYRKDFAAKNLVTKDKLKEGYKADEGKDPWHLVPWDAVRGIVKVLALGSKKYSDRNWEKGMAWSRPYSALMRHMTAWWERDISDPETGYSHLWHAGCCIFFLIAFELRNKGIDDRPKEINGNGDCTWTDVTDTPSWPPSSSS